LHLTLEQWGVLATSTLVVERLNRKLLRHVCDSLVKRTYRG